MSGLKNYLPSLQDAQQRINKAAGKAVAYLENQLPTIDDDYVLSLTSYALSLANSQQATTAFTMLMDDVIAKGKLQPQLLLSKEEKKCHLIVIGTRKL